MILLRRCLFSLTYAIFISDLSNLCSQTHFIQFAAFRKARSASVDKEQTDAVGDALRSRVSYCDNDDDVTHEAIGDEGLASIEYPIGAISLRRRSDSL